jgi:hypothetical protein
MQFEQPDDVTGVPVALCAVDPNGNYQDLGTTTTDVEGNYGFMFEPEVPGQYMIIATFEGTNAYYGSHETTYIGVDPAPAPATSIEPEPTETVTEPEPTETEQPTEAEQPVTEAPLISTEVLIVVAVAVVAVIGVAVFWVIRKRG